MMMHEKVLCILNFKETKESWQKLRDKSNFPNLIIKKNNLCSYILKKKKTDVIAQGTIFNVL